jgi:hypothetical protein
MPSFFVVAARLAYCACARSSRRARQRSSRTLTLAFSRIHGPLSSPVGN